MVTVSNKVERGIGKRGSTCINNKTAECLCLISKSALSQLE